MAVLESTGSLGALGAAAMRRLGRATVARQSGQVILDLRAVTGVTRDGVDALVDLAYEAGDADIAPCLVADTDRRDEPLIPNGAARVAY